MNTSTRPAEGTQAADVHRTAHTMRAHVAEGTPHQALRVARDLPAGVARSVAAVLVLSETWPAERRDQMGYPPRPEPDHDQILRDNARRRQRTTTPITWGVEAA